MAHAGLRSGSMEFEGKIGALDDEDLVVGEKEGKNWKGIVISFMVIGSILGAIVVAIILLTPNGEVDSNRMKLDFDNIVGSQYQANRFNGSWLSEHEFVFVDQNGSIVIFDALTNRTSSVLVKTQDKTMHTMAKFSLSADRQSILFITGQQRQEFGATISTRYAIFNVTSQTVQYLDDLFKASYPGGRAPHIQFATLSPSSNSLLLVESNDLYLVADFSRTSKIIRLTRTAGQMESLVQNGLPDTLYRMHIFTEPNEPAIWWSPDGRYLAFLEFDDSQVESSPIEFYDNLASLDSGQTNPKIHNERYPRAGQLNPRVTVRVVDLLASTNSDEVDLASIMAPDELVRQATQDARLGGHYVTYVGWLPASSNQLLISWLNRAQNGSMLSICRDGLGSQPANTWRCDQVASFSQRLPPAKDARHTIMAAQSANGTRLIFLAMPRPDSVIGDHLHVALVRGDERAHKFLTFGDYDVDKLLAYEPAEDALYFEVLRSSDAERHLYRVSLAPGQRPAECLTCNLLEPCTYSENYVSPGARYLIHECLGPGVPVGRLRSLQHQRMASQTTLVSNEHLEQLLKSKQVPIEKFIVIKRNQEIPYDVFIKLYLPNEIEEEKDKRFPLLIESSELDRRKVWRRFDLDWGQYLSSRKQLIYAKVDCIRQVKPSGHHVQSMAGPAPVFSYVAGEIGAAYPSLDADERSQLEDSPLFNALDQVEVIRYLVDHPDLFPYIDRRRVAIWGPTSTASYAALASTINDDSRLIQCTIAISPITNWRYMSSYAAEHYLGLPWLAANAMRYERSNLLKRSYELSSRKLLLIHGTADEQVHVQHSMQFIRSLTDGAHHLAPALIMSGGIIHQMQLYPDVGHSFDQVLRHFYMTLDGFIDRCFYQKPITIKATEWKGKVRPKLYI